LAWCWRPRWLPVSGSWSTPSCTLLVPIPERAEGNAARRRASTIAGHTGDELAARAALHDPAHEVRASALGALARIGALEPFEVSGALADPAPEVRRRACDLVGRLQFLQLAPQLTETLGDGSAPVVEAACYALGELEGLSADSPAAEGTGGQGRGGGSPVEGEAPAGGDAEAAVMALTATATSHPDPLCREAAVAALGSLRAAAGLSAVMAALHDKPAVRRRAVVALAGFDGPEVDAALARAAEDVDWQVRQVAEDLRGYRPRP
jgi:HEAT repeat protein